MDEKDEKERSYIHIEFTEMGYTAHETSFKNVDPYQFFLIIEELKMIAQSGLVQQMQQQRQQQIIIPKANMPVL